ATNPLARLTNVTNFSFINCYFKETYGSPLVYLGDNGLATATFDYCIFDDSSNYGVQIKDALSADFTNCVFIGAQSGFLINEFSATVTAVNCIFTVPAKTSSTTNPFTNSGGGTISTSNCIILPNGNNPSR